MNNKEAIKILDRLLNIFEYEDYDAIERAIEVMKASEWQEIDATTPEKYDCYGVFAFRDKSGEWIFFLGYCDICQEGCPIVDLEYGEEAPYTLEDYTHYKKIGIPKESE
jgi:hypothetical protein